MQPGGVDGAFFSRFESTKSDARSATIASLRGSNGARSTATRFGLAQPVTLPRPSPSQRVLPTCMRYSSPLSCTQLSYSRNL